MDGTTNQLIREVVECFGGRFSRDVGIDVDRGDDEIERWFLASTVFGNRIDSPVAVRAFRMLDERGLSTIQEVASCDHDALIETLGRDRLFRHDHRTTARLFALAEHATFLLPDGASGLGRRYPDSRLLRHHLESLPGWGPLTTRSFLRELRGVWPGADLPVDPLALRAACHLGIARPDDDFDANALTMCAEAAGLDARDLEAALVRVTLAHHRSFDGCDGATDRRCPLVESDVLDRGTR